MGQHLSDTSTAATPDSPSVHYSSGQEGVRFRGFHRSDSDYQAYTRLHAQSSNVSGTTYSSDVTVTPARGRRSPSALRRQLHINIPADNADGRLPSFGSESDLDLQRQLESDTSSIGGFSLLPNYSPTSLYEKNLRLSDSGDIVEGEDRLSVKLRNKDGLTSSQTSLGYHSNRNSLSSNREADETFHTVDDDPTLYWSMTSQPESPSSNLPKSPISPQQGKSVMTDSGIRSNSNSVSPRHSTPNDDRGEAKVPAVERVKSEGSSRTDTHSCSSPISDCSDLSGRDFTFRDSRIEYSEGSGIVTPDSEIFSPGDVGLRTVQGMEELGHELRALQDEIEDMSVRVRFLSREDVTDSESASESGPSANPAGKDPGHEESVSRLEAREEEFHKAMTLLRRHRSPKSSDSRGSLTEEGESDPKEHSHGPHSTRSDYSWDYASDIAAQKGFVNHRPVVPRLEDDSDSSRGTSGVASPTLEHVRAYLQSLEGNASLDLTNSSSSRQASLSISDVYIDDEYSRCGEMTSSPEKSKDGSPEITQPPKIQSPVNTSQCSSISSGK